MTWKNIITKTDEETVKEIMSLVRSKVKDTDVIEERYFMTKDRSIYIYA